MIRGPPPLSATRPDQDRPSEPPGTLGDILYADSARSRIPEHEWAALVRAIAGRDPRALQALYERAHRPAFTLILRITQSREAAEELTVDVFHEVWRRAAQYDGSGGSVLGWIMNLAHSRAIDRLRFEGRKKRVMPSTGAPLSECDVRSDEVLEFKQQSDRLREALALLTPAERTAIETAFFGELTYVQVAARLNQPLGTIKTRIRSGLGKLRQALSAPLVRS
jgi:RNA polymerase sigma-70 factor, ECF subfamily